ncbi:uncharacterized protein [Henckelia pumila]|uniref:uncharacterized protein isoform X2 n=1 Tax=Henckelia pumila TaxID=405737 RepID=UPI003C6E4962
MKKKKFLGDMGFDSKVQARLKCSSTSTPDQPNEFLKRLIQQARIINFDEEVIEETMMIVPLMKENVDHYSGPDRVSAKQQQEEIERVTKSLPASSPASVKHFTERAVLSLQLKMFPEVSACR